MVVGPDDDEHADAYLSSHYALIRQRCLPVVIIWLHKVGYNGLIWLPTTCNGLQWLDFVM